MSQGTSTERTRAYRARQRPEAKAARTMAERVYKLLVDHPEFMAQAERFLKCRSEELKTKRPT